MTLEERIEHLEKRLGVRQWLTANGAAEHRSGVGGPTEVVTPTLSTFDGELEGVPGELPHAIPH